MVKRDKKLVDKKQLKAKLLKIKLAGIHTPKITSTPEARRGLIQDTPVVGSEGNQDKLKQNADFINRKKPIDPTGSKINTRLKKKLAKIREAKISHEHGHTIIFKGHPKGIYRVASLESQQGHYAKYWLLNAKQSNGNGWGIAAHSAKTNMHKFIGKPLVITSAKWRGSKIKDKYGDTFDHPYIPTNDLNKIFEHQEQYRVGNIVDIGEKDGDYFAMIEMLPKFANMTLPPFCSPAIYQLDAREAEGQISKWEALHLAALDTDPAYGARIAILRGTCVGSNNECRIQFRSAKQKTAVKLISDEHIRSLREKLGPNNNFPDDNIKRSPEDSRRNFNIQTRGIARDKLDSITSLTRRDNPKTPLIKKVPFGKERRPKKDKISGTLKESDRRDEFLALDFTNELNPISSPPKPRQQDRTRIIQAKQTGIVCTKNVKSKLAELRKKQKVAFKMFADEEKGVKGGLSKFMKNRNQTRLERNIFDKIISDKGNSSVLLDKIQRIKDDRVGIVSSETGLTYDEFGDDKSLVFGNRQDDGSIFGDVSIGSTVEGNLRNRLQKKTGQDPNKTSDILQRIQSGKPLQERVTSERISKLKQKISKIDTERHRVNIDDIIKRDEQLDKTRKKTPTDPDQINQEDEFKISGRKIRPKGKRVFDDADKFAKLKLKLASLGEQNMTFQNSKKIKIHKRKHPEVRKDK